LFVFLFFFSSNSHFFISMRWSAVLIVLFMIGRTDY